MCWIAVVANGGDTKLHSHPVKGRRVDFSFLLEYYPEASINIGYLLSKATCQCTVIAYNRNAQRLGEGSVTVHFIDEKPSCGAMKFLALGHTGSWWQRQKVKLVLES